MTLQPDQPQRGPIAPGPIAPGSIASGPIAPGPLRPATLVFEQALPAGPAEAAPGAAPGPASQARPKDRLRRHAAAAVRALLREARRPALEGSTAMEHGAVVAAAGTSAARPEGVLRVASYNVHKCVGTDRRFDPARTAAVIAELGADLVALQEADRRFGRRTGLLDAAALEAETGLAPLPVSQLEDGHGWHGNALLVRRGTPATLRRLSLPGAEPRGAVIAELMLPAGPLRVVAAHFGLLHRSRLWQARAILEALEEGPAMPTLMLGDLNEWRPAHRSSLRPLAPMFGAVAGGPPSFPSRLPVLALDRILGWPQGLLGPVRVHDTPLARTASDHLPLTASVALARAAAVAGAGLAAAA
jgi:endonuclease/exonuclease/phosphatase family metal-dependent hydrolase